MMLFENPLVQYALASLIVCCCGALIALIKTHLTAAQLHSAFLSEEAMRKAVAATEERSAAVTKLDSRIKSTPLAKRSDALQLYLLLSGQPSVGRKEQALLDAILGSTVGVGATGNNAVGVPHDPR